MKPSVLWAILGLASALLLPGCGGGGGTDVPVDTSPPHITTQPQAQTVDVGGTATFTVQADGRAIAFQWLQSTSAVGHFTEIPGATQASYTINAVTAQQDGLHFAVIVTNTFGSAASTPVRLTVRTSGGGGLTTSQRCSPWEMAAGTTVSTDFEYPANPSLNATSTTTHGGRVVFNGRSLVEVRLVQLVLAVPLDVKVYGEPDTATGRVTLHGTLSVAGSGANSAVTTSVLATPAVDLEFSLAAGGTAPAQSLSYTDTVVATVDGVVQPPQTNTRTDTSPALTFEGFETVTVPAGTFVTCRMRKGPNAGSPKDWLLAGHGTVVKDSSGGQARTIRVNGSVITAN